MSDSEVIPGGAPLPANTLNLIALAAYPPGTPVYKTGGKATKAIATSAAASRIVGLTAFQSTANERVHTQYAGPLTLTAAQWNALITGATVGLVEGTYYYVSDATAGLLRATAPTGGNGHFVAPVGVALSALTLLIFPQNSVVSSG